MNKIILTLLTLILFSGLTFGQRVEKKYAETIAKEIYKRNNLGKTTIVQDVIPIGNDNRKDTLIYIVPFEKSGFAIVSAQFAAPPVLGYCFKGTYNPDSIPPGLKYLIEKYKAELNYLKKEKLKPNKEVENIWNEMLNGINLKSYSIGTHLLTTEWGQEGNYNNLCPNDYPAGCTAVAMAQILRYWECRIAPLGTVCYSGFGWTGACENIGSQTYNWNSMGDGFAESDNQLLIYMAGVSCQTHYNPDGSSSTPGRARDGFVYNWGISSSADVRSRIMHLSTWKNDLKNELNLERPILYSASGLLGGGHSWVIEGYNPQDEFYCNWGWADINDCNGWYSLGNFNVLGDSFNQYESAIFNVYPANPAVGTPNLPDKVFTYNPGGYTLTIVPPYGATSYEWTTTSGTISGSGNSITLYTDKTATVQVRVYGEQCEVYSPYDAATITINYGPMSATDLICYSGNTVSVQNVPSGATVTWGGTNVSYPNGNTGSSVTVRAISSTNSYNGTITATISVGGTSSTLSKAVWVGPPKVTGISGDMSVPTFQNTRYYPIYEGVKSSPTDYEWYVNPDYGVSYNNYGLSTLVNFSNIGYYQIICSALNTCGWGNYYFSDFINVYGSYSLMITPNPSSGETTISIETGESGDISAMGTAETAFDETAEWELEVFDNVQNLKEKKIKLKGKNASINTQNWKEGVYLVRASYKDKILTGKLVVNN